MLVGQTAGVGRQVCLSVIQLGRQAGAGMLVGQTARVGGQVCWLVNELG